MERLLSWNVCYHGTFSPWIVCFMERLVHIAFCSQEALYQIGCCVPIQDVMSPITFCPLDFISQRTLCSVHITLCVIRCFSMHWTFGSCTILHSRTCCPMVMLSLSWYILSEHQQENMRNKNGYNAVTNTVNNTRTNTVNDADTYVVNDAVEKTLSTQNSHFYFIIY